MEVFKYMYCKITYFCWDFILHFCHIVSLQQSKIRIFGRVVINRKPFKYFHIHGFHFRDHTTLAKIKHTQK
jgi:hypothetical protein